MRRWGNRQIRRALAAPHSEKGIAPSAAEWPRPKPERAPSLSAANRPATDSLPLSKLTTLAWGPTGKRRAKRHVIALLRAKDLGGGLQCWDLPASTQRIVRPRVASASISINYTPHTPR